MAKELYKLENTDPDDQAEVLLKIGQSFGFEFDDTNPFDPPTFGGMMHDIISRITGIDTGGCTTQQAFYKIRRAIADTQDLDKRKIIPTTKLEELFPKGYRRLLASSFCSQLGFRIPILHTSRQTRFLLELLFGITFIVFFFNWKFAILLLIISILITSVAIKMAITLAFDTVGDLARHASKYYYALSRRHAGTINCIEINKQLRKTFAEDLGLDPSVLTDDAKL